MLFFFVYKDTEKHIPSEMEENVVLKDARLLSHMVHTLRIIRPSNGGVWKNLYNRGVLGSSK